MPPRHADCMQCVHVGGTCRHAWHSILMVEADMDGTAKTGARPQAPHAYLTVPSKIRWNVFSVSAVPRRTSAGATALRLTPAVAGERGCAPALLSMEWHMK